MGTCPEVEAIGRGGAKFDHSFALHSPCFRESPLLGGFVR